MAATAGICTGSAPLPLCAGCEQHDCGEMQLEGNVAAVLVPWGGPLCLLWRSPGSSVMKAVEKSAEVAKSIIGHV